MRDASPRRVEEGDADDSSEVQRRRSQFTGVSLRDKFSNCIDWVVGALDEGIVDILDLIVGSVHLNMHVSVDSCEVAGALHPGERISLSLLEAELAVDHAKAKDSHSMPSFELP